MKSPSRNDPCTCGSGRKYKHCCGQCDQTPATNERPGPVMQDVSLALRSALDHHNAGRLSQAKAIYQQIIQAEPNHDQALHLLGLIANQEGEHDRAVELMNRSIRTAVPNPVYYYNLGVVYKILNRLDEAIDCYQKALTINPDDADTLNNLGVALKGQGKLDESITCYRKALTIKPHDVTALNNLGIDLKTQGNLAEAMACYREALAIKPNDAETHNNLANTLKELGKVDEAIVCYRKALAIRPDYIDAHTNRLLAAHYAASYSPATLFAEHLSYAEQFETPLKHSLRPHANIPDPERRLKVGYVSPDFRNHSVAYFIEPVFANHDKSRVEVYGYYIHNQHDSFTGRLIAEADHWLECTGMTDDQLAERIRADGIDILVDLAGHTGKNRLLVFARKPSPVQVTYLGYPDTTGLSAMDYRLTDIYADPPGVDDEFYTEERVRLPHTFLCYRPQDNSPEVQTIPALRNGFVTFGSLNLLSKITPDVVALWSRILLAVPGSRMLMKSGALNQTEASAYVLGLFAQHGVAEDRIILLARDADFNQHMSRYHEMDICLDPFPYNGTTTSCEALWMGVPMVALAGVRHSGRVGASLLNAVGLQDWLAYTPEQYVAIATIMAADIRRLAELRAGLRGRMAGSLLCDGKLFTENLEAAYREMWRRYCASLAQR